MLLHKMGNGKDKPRGGNPQFTCCVNDLEIFVSSLKETLLFSVHRVETAKNQILSLIPRVTELQCKLIKKLLWCLLLN